eukprot:4469637-Prymnesium_polylepis.1
MLVEPRVDPRNSQYRACQRYGNEGDCFRSLPVSRTADARSRYRDAAPAELASVDEGLVSPSSSSSSSSPSSSHARESRLPTAWNCRLSPCGVHLARHATSGAKSRRTDSSTELEADSQHVAAALPSGCNIQGTK